MRTNPTPKRRPPGAPFERCSRGLPWLLLASCLLGWAPAARAGGAADQLPIAERYALVIGHNAPGPGQRPLRYAERDAEAFAGVLTELGAFAPERVTLLKSPDADEVREALDALGVAVDAHSRQGARTLVTFYYSGHARGDRLDLGERPLPLDELRAGLDGLGATVTLVILDACRSGAFSRVKGAKAVADFGFDEARQLNARGLAVMASSTGQELSQESERLEGSFFTHHLLVALRGGADDDADGRVSLVEAYRYAYNQTLQSTARTAVGQQHVTFEAGLRGRGDLWLTAPSESLSQLAIGADLHGEILISRRGARGVTVIAELHKPEGTAARIATPPGRYTGVVRRGGALGQCDFTIAPASVALLSAGDCRFAPVTVAEAKGASSEAPLWSGRWSFELAVGLSGNRSDDYTARLEAFDYRDQDDLLNLHPRLALTVGKQITPEWDVLLTLRNLGHGHWRRTEHVAGPPGSDQSRVDDYRYYSVAAMGLLRRRFPFLEGRLVPYLQGGLGPVAAWDELEGDDSPLDFGLGLLGGGGVQAMPWPWLGAFVEGELSYAPALENLLGDTHDHGGAALYIGLRGDL